MELNDVRDFFNGRGLGFRWRKEPNAGNREAILRPLNGSRLDMGTVEVAIVIPDIHLGLGNDIFHTADTAGTADRLLRFLNALADLRDQLGAERFRVVQLGDWYDFYRVAPLLSVEAKVSAIEAQYGDICRAARTLPVFHCIGNHDAALYKNPHATLSQFGIAQPLGSNGVMAFHGHDNQTLQAIEKEDAGAVIGLSFVNLVAMVPLLGSLVNFLQMVDDDSFEEPWTKGNTSQDKLWPPAASPLDGWDAPWVARNDAGKLVLAARGLEYLTDTALQVVFVGHTHRPGIAWADITAERSIPIVDVGSWTYGRAEIAIVTPQAVGLAAIPVV